LVHLCALFVSYSVAAERSIIICKYIAGKFVRDNGGGELELEGVIRRNLLFYKLRRGLQQRALAEYRDARRNPISFILGGQAEPPRLRRLV